VGRIVTPVKVENALDPSKHLVCDALVDTGASHLVLPSAWKDRLGRLSSSQAVETETATQDHVKAEICGPVRIQIEGFRPIHTEVLFVDMHPADGMYEPLVGYIPLEQSQAAVDMLGHRLVPVKHLDLK
jgi:predicted aspartyl protease